MEKFLTFYDETKTENNLTLFSLLKSEIIANSVLLNAMKFDIISAKPNGIFPIACKGMKDISNKISN